MSKIPDPTDAAIVRMHVIDGLKLSEVARRLGLEYETTRVHYWDNVQRLQRDLRDWL